MNPDLVRFDYLPENALMRISIQGEIPFQLWEEILTQFKNQVSLGQARWHINLTRLTFLDTTGMGTLIAMAVSLRNHPGSFELYVEGDSQPEQLFKIGKLDKILTIHAVEPDLDKLPQGFVPLSLIGGLVAGPAGPQVAVAQGAQAGKA